MSELRTVLIEPVERSVEMLGGAESQDQAGLLGEAALAVAKQPAPFHQEQF